MSEVKVTEPVYAPALFPKTRRLPIDPEAVRNNYHLQMAEFEAHRQKLNAERGFRGASTCARSLHISLFFDGTNNNEDYDTYKAELPHQVRAPSGTGVEVSNERRLVQAVFV